MRDLGKAVIGAENNKISASLSRLDIALVAQNLIRMLNGYRAYSELICKQPL